MQMRVSFHFHAYQPGDVILRRPGSPQSPPVFAERRSPVSLRMGDELIKGDNWTDAMLRFYGAIWKLFSEVGPGSRESGVGSRDAGAGGRVPGAGSGDAGTGKDRTVSVPAPGTRPPAPGVPAPFCSVDIEPATLQMLAEKQPASFEAFRELVRDRVVDPVATVPFHVLLPHADPQEQRFLSLLAFRLHKDVWGGPAGSSRALGFWFPESLYSERAGQSVVQSFVDCEFPERRRNGHSPRMLFFVVDRGQFVGMSLPQGALSANMMVVDTEKVAVFGRDRELSDRWAFKHGTVQDLVEEALSCRTDERKEEKGIPYDLTMASDLESLAGSADQGERFRRLKSTFGGAGIEMLSHSTFLERKLRGSFPSWEGELESKPFIVRLRDFSSWSDYIDQGVAYPSDTRWTGIHRWDGLVVSRPFHRGPLSQIWKQGLMKVQGRLSRFVGKVVYEALERCLAPGRSPGRLELERFLLEYHRLVFSPLLTASGRPGEAGGFGAVLDATLPGCRRGDEAAWAARAYYEMLLSNRSCPRFWDHLDTRVTFQAVVFLSHSLLDLAESCTRLGMDGRALEARQLLLSDLVNFRDAYRYYNLGSLFGSLGWEVTEDAWHMATASEVLDKSGYDVVKRAALFVALRQNSDAASRALSEADFDPAQVVADCGHIEGERHGDWERPDYCENSNIP